MSVPSPGELLMNRHLLPLATALLVFLAPASAETKFKPVRTQFLAALGDPQSTSGVNADTWGLWQVDPGPRGVRLSNFPLLVANGGVAPSEWIFEKSKLVAGGEWLDHGTTKPWRCTRSIHGHR